MSDVYNCPYHYTCGCYCTLSVKTYAEKVEVALAGEHTASTHTRSSCIMSVKQRSAVKRADPPRMLLVARFTPTWRTSAPASEFRKTVEARNLSSALSAMSGKRLLWRKGIPASIEIDSTEGSMNRLAYSICLMKLIERHNDPADDFHTDER
jgi:hypothetical protein